MTWLLPALVLACGPAPEDIAANLASDNPAVREDTAKIAKNFDSEAVRAALVKALDDPSEAVRLNAVDSIAEIGAEEAVPALIHLVEDDPSDLVKRDAVDALGRLKAVEAVPVLISYIEAREDTRVPLNAVWALGFIGDKRALPLLARLRDNPDPYVAYNANEALRNLKP